ncbi:hypothetical protein niasHT_010293 [Heterodera trifolii]|uniref:Mesoderm induction early response protein 1 n=1 Tax=Heterodera trifolii TaxID=157864 RepID=A0ABD2M6H3_9BILA
MADDDAQSDYEEEEEEDDEATLDEEEANLSSGDDCDNELRQLQEDGELSLEELQRKYYGGGEEREDENADSDEVLPSSSDAVDGLSSAAQTVASLRDRVFSAISDTCGQLSQTIRAYFQADDLEEDDDTEDYEPPVLLKKSVRIGPQFQVTELPKRVQSMENQPLDELAEKLWCPSTDRCPNAFIDAYLTNFAQIKAVKKPCRNPSAPSTTPLADGRPANVPDDEDALLALMKHNYDPKAAKDSFMCSDETSQAFESANAPKRTQPTRPLAWTDEECEQFERAMNKHYKCFWKIHRDFLPCRTVGELVTFYYSWKKSERYDLWKAEKCRREQQMDARTTDFMGQLLDSVSHGENIAIEGGDKETTENSKPNQSQNGVGPMDKREK